MAGAVAFERGKLVLEDQLGVVQQASDQGRLAVIDGAAGQKAQQGFLFLIGQIGDHVAGNILDHQKYPSRFFFSIDPASSLSIMRPWRSEVLAVSISRTIACRSLASDSTAPVSG